MELIESFMKTKENGNNIYKDITEHMTEELQKYPCLHEKGNEG